MKMLKTRKKWISLLVTLTFLLTLFPLALPAFAATKYEPLITPTVVDKDGVKLGQVRIAIDPLTPGTHEAYVSLPNDFKVNQVKVVDISGTGFTANDALKVANTNIIVDTVDAQNKVTAFKDETNATVVLPKTATVGNRGFALKITNAAKIEKFEMTLEFNDVNVPKGTAGAINATFESLNGQLLDGEVLIGRTSKGALDLQVTKKQSFADNGNVSIRVRESVVGSLKTNDILRLTLPRGFEWGLQGTPVEDVFGDPVVTPSTITPTANGRDLEIKYTGAAATNARTAFDINAIIKVEDYSDVKYGDVEASVRGDYTATPESLVVGTYGDFGIVAEAAEAKTIYAANVGQKIADITVKETLAGSFVVGRHVILTLPEWAKWGRIGTSYANGAYKLNLVDFPGKDGRTARFVVDNNTGSGLSKIKMDKLEVVLSPWAELGDLVVEFSGSSGVSGEVKVAEVKDPVAVEIADTPTIVIGRSGQEIGEITIAETKEGMLKKGKTVSLTLPKDVDWDEYDVEVTEGDVEIKNIKKNYEKLTFEIKRTSDKASTITVNGTVVAYRTVPEGNVRVEVGGTAIIEVNDDVRVRKSSTDNYYDNPTGTSNLTVKGMSPIGTPATVPVLVSNYDTDGLWKDETYVAKEAIAKVGTPAPGDLKATAVFTVGSTEYTVDGFAKAMDAAPYIKDGRTFLPLRFVGEAVGVPEDGILWAGKTATFMKGDRIVQVTIGSKDMLINGAKVEMDVAPEILNGRTMLPIRWVGTAFGADLDWNNEAKTVTVN